MKYLSKHFFVGITSLVLFSAALFAAPDYIKFQGRLTDSQGRPIAGTPQVSFELYDAATAGTRIWVSTGFQNVNSNEMGLFTADVGPFSSPSIFSGGQNLFLQVTIKAGTAQSNQVLSPRQRLSNVPYSFHAGEADKAATADSVPDNSISGNKIQLDAVGSNQIADRSVEQVDLSTTIASQFIPSGMIAMFARDCPDDWTRFSILDNRFPLGAVSYSSDSSDNLGGSNIISGLAVSTDGAHTHVVDAHRHPIPHRHAVPTAHSGGGGNQISPQIASWGQGSESIVTTYTYMQIEGASTAANEFHKSRLPDTPDSEDASPGTDSKGNHIHQVMSDGSWRPPYLGIVFCEKD